MPPGALEVRLWPRPVQVSTCGCCWKTAFCSQKCHSIQKGDGAGMVSHCDDWYATGPVCTAMVPLEKPLPVWLSG